MPVPAVSVQVGPGFDKFIKSSEILLRRYGETKENPVYKEMGKLIKPLVPIIKTATPVATGTLRSTVRSRVRFSKKTGKVIGEVGYFFIGRHSNEYGRLIAARGFEKNRRTIRKAGKRIEPTFRNQFARAIIREADKVIGR